MAMASRLSSAGSQKNSDGMPVPTMKPVTPMAAKPAVAQVTL